MKDSTLYTQRSRVPYLLTKGTFCISEWTLSSETIEAILAGNIKLVRNLAECGSISGHYRSNAGRTITFFIVSFHQTKSGEWRLTVRSSTKPRSNSNAFPPDERCQLCSHGSGTPTSTLRASKKTLHASGKPRKTTKS